MNQTRDWAEKLKAGDKEAFNHLVKECYGICLRRATAYTKDESAAKDLVQEALVQAYLSIGKLEDPTKFKAWVMGILRNTCNNYHRSKKSPMLNLPDELFQIPEETVAFEDDELIRKRVREAVEQLSHKNKEVIEAFYFDNLSIEEISRHFDLSVSATKVRLHRARKALKYVLTVPANPVSNYLPHSSLQLEYFHPNCLYSLQSLEVEKLCWKKVGCAA
ncbi:MAG: sigma-70 family RNA polymerase sigma factor [Chitinophagales bacterium]